MGKVVYLMNVSLDGFVETPDHSLDWGKVDDELHGWFNDRQRATEVSAYGRRLWEVMSANWPTGEADPDATETMREFARIWNASRTRSLSPPPPASQRWANVWRSWCG